MIAAIWVKEIVQRRAILTVTFILVCAIAAVLPTWFAFSLREARSHATNETAALILQNFKSYALFAQSTWSARGLARTLMLLALFAGAGAIAGEREANTEPLLYRSALPLAAFAAIKFVAIATWLFIVAFTSTAILTALSLVQGHTLSTIGIAVAALIAWGNALAFLAVVFAASALATRTIVAGVLALVAGFTLAAALRPFGFNGTALAVNIFTPGGGLDTTLAIRDGLVAATIVTLALAFALMIVTARPRT